MDFVIDWMLLLAGPAIVAAIVLLVLWNVLKAHRKLRAMRQQTLAWYGHQHPGRVTDRGVSCATCNSTNMGTELLRGGTFLRRHFCRKCGSTLYYSPES